MFKKSLLAFWCSAVFFAVPQSGAGAFTGEFDDLYYKERPQFHFYPAHDVARFTIDHIGPIGIGLELRQPAFTMHIISVEPGSPAAATGKLKPGQIIESINGKILKDIDPRIILGNLITEAEATDGVLKMMVKEAPGAAAQEVVVKIPVLGGYSDTWPLGCEKSDKIVRNFADFLTTHPKGWGSALFLLSTGEEKDLEVVREWFSGKVKGPGGNPWDTGYTGPAICEYYLRTGDESVLPAIKSMTEKLKETIYNGSWMGRGGCNYNYMAGGHMNAAGVHCLTFLLLAKECGVDVDEHTLQSCLYHFYRYAGHWNVSYGDGLPEEGGVDNGKNGGLAFAMAAAASLSPDGENSVYAKARDISANKSFYTTSWLFHGHTGGGIGEIWRGAAAGLLYNKRPEMYRSFMNERAWMYELARRHDGAFGWASGMNVNYGTTGHKGGRAWGNYVPLIYTIPRKQLRIFGAPPTQFSKPYAIPPRPWGTPADEAFYDLEPGEYKPGQQQDLSKETIPTHASMPLMGLMGDPKVSDDLLLMFAHHPDSAGQGTAGGNINQQGRIHLIIPLLKSNDPRGRYTGLRAAAGKRKGGATPVELTDEIMDLVGGMITNPGESWWVVMEALKLMGLASADQIAPYSDRISHWLKHEDWWLRHAALTAVTPLAVDKRFYQRMLPVVGDVMAENTRAVALGPVRDIVNALQEADPEVQAFAVQTFGQSYAAYPTEFLAPGGQDMSNCVDYMLKGMARNLADTPGGFDKLYELSSKRFPEQALPHKDLYMRADASKFGPKVREALKPVVVDTLIPQFIGYGDYRGNNSDLLRAEAASTKFTSQPKMPELVALYNRIGVHEYDWHNFGPDMSEIKWEYHTFDPPEEKIWEPGWRYRKVTVPVGMEHWFKPEFAAKAAGWKIGNAPFGQLGGKLVTEQAGSKSIVEIYGCQLDFCRCNEPMNTLWEKEVLLMRTKLKLPKFKEGHMYRVCVGGMSHVNGGDGLEIYVNGKQLLQRNAGVGKRAGGRAIAAFLTREWWPDFEDEVTIAAKGFLPIPGGKRSPGVKRQHFSVFLQEMKAPPITEEVILKGRLLQPMLSSAWQASQADEDKFVYAGEFSANRQLVGAWTAVAEVAGVDAFDPSIDQPDGEKPAFAELRFKEDGQTDDALVRWSGSTLMHLGKFEALAIQIEEVGGQEYLFIEAGGFSKKNPEDWSSPWVVLKRK